MDVIFALPGGESLAGRLSAELSVAAGAATLRQFPDGEWYVRVDTEVAGRDVLVAGSLHRPDERTLALLMLAATLRDLGAARVGLVAPYLAYMRQDRRFRPGEGVTSGYFARLLSGAVDWLVTVDPHLHRRASLGEVYTVPSAVAHAAPALAAWVRARVERPLVVGPDAESEQWVRSVAEAAGAPYVVLEKERRGDRDVEVSVPHVDRHRDRTPVLVDDIVSTARTMIETIRHLARAGLPPAVCLGVHAVFAGSAYDDLLAAGAARVVTANTIRHPSNDVDVVPLLAAEVRALTRERGGHRPGA